MKILAIETSCDDTGIAILQTSNNGDFKVLANEIASQIELGKKYGGVYPMMAKRAHEKNLAPTLKTALSRAKISLKNIDLIAVTNGPGLEPCLWTGINFAKDLSKKYNIPLVPVNHIEGHILVNFLNLNQVQKMDDRPFSEPNKISFPAVALVVSGGHTQIILVKNIGKYEILGETRDDAAGECFDKCAKILGLEYPGGPIIAKLAEKALGCPTPQRLPRPMMYTKDYDFSFSGLKTAVLYHHQKQNKTTQKSKEYIIDMCGEIQQAIIDVLLKKTIKAAKDYGAKTIILGGGVTANHELKTQLFIKMKEIMPETELLFPEIEHSTDNGLMIAIAGYFNKNKKVAPSKVATIKADGNLRISH